MDNKKSYIAAAMIVALAAVAGMSYLSYAQTNDSSTTNSSSSQSSNDDRFFGRGMMGRNMTEEERAQWETQREERMKEMDAKREAVEAALNNNDFEAWKTAVGTDSPLLDKINEGNFAKLVEAHKLNAQSRAIMAELGIDGPGMGMGGKGMGRGGFGGGCGMHGSPSDAQADSSGTAGQSN